MPKTRAADQPQPSACAIAAPSAVATPLWTSAPDANAARRATLDVKPQADAEHQQHDADFRDLPGEARIGDKAWCVGPTSIPASSAQRVATGRRAGSRTRTRAPPRDRR